MLEKVFFLIQVFVVFLSNREYENPWNNLLIVGEGEEKLCRKDLIQI